MGPGASAAVGGSTLTGGCEADDSGGWQTNWNAVMASPRTVMKVVAAAVTTCIALPPSSAVVRPPMAEAIAEPIRNATKQAVRRDWTEDPEARVR